MKIKKYLLILCIVLVFICVSNTVNALKIEKLDDTSVIIHKNKSIITIHITPYDTPSKTKMKKELNKINKIVVKINGKTVNTIKKGKGWKKYASFNSGSYPEIIDRTTIVKKNLKGKTLGVYVYNSKNKIIKWKISNIKPIYISKVKVTNKQAIKITKEIKDADKYPINITKAVLKKGRFDIPYYWKVTITEPGTTWKEDVYIDAISGNTFNPIVELV